MNNIEYSIDQHGTLHRLEDVLRFYSSAADSQYVGSSLNRPMDEGIGHASTSYLAGYSQPTYTSPHEINYSTPYATGGFYESAYLHGRGRLYGDSTGVQVSAQVIAANSTSHSPLQNFVVPQLKYFKGVGAIL